VFRALSDGPTLGLFARRCAALVAERPDRLGDCPDPEDVMALAARQPGAAADLAALAKALTKAKAAVAKPGAVLADLGGAEGLGERRFGGLRRVRLHARRNPHNGNSGGYIVGPCTAVVARRGTFANRSGEC
jgi:hypothetical protein